MCLLDSDKRVDKRVDKRAPSQHTAFGLSSPFFGGFGGNRAHADKRVSAVDPAVLAVRGGPVVSPVGVFFGGYFR